MKDQHYGLVACAPLNVMLESRVGTSSCHGCSSSDSAPCWCLRRGTENDPSAWALPQYWRPW